MEKYIIIGVGTDVPYFTFGCVKSFDGNAIEWTRNEREAIAAPLSELEAAANFIRRNYRRSNGKVDIMPWFYRIDENGKVDSNRTFYKDFK